MWALPFVASAAMDLFGGYGTKAGAARHGWINFVREWAAAQNPPLSYHEALKNSSHNGLRDAYHQQVHGRNRAPPVKARAKPEKKYVYHRGHAKYGNAIENGPLSAADYWAMHGKRGKGKAKAKPIRAKHEPGGWNEVLPKAEPLREYKEEKEGKYLLAPPEIEGQYVPFAKPEIPEDILPIQPIYNERKRRDSVAPLEVPDQIEGQYNQLQPLPLPEGYELPPLLEHPDVPQAALQELQFLPGEVELKLPNRNPIKQRPALRSFKGVNANLAKQRRQAIIAANRQQIPKQLKVQKTAKKKKKKNQDLYGLARPSLKHFSQRREPLEINLARDLRLQGRAQVLAGKRAKIQGRGGKLRGRGISLREWNAANG